MHRHAFSLVELSIVLVILGLLVGGVLSGQSLIRASQLRSIPIDHAKYYGAVKSFKDKYFGVPGDITNATQFWGQRAANPTCAITASTDKLTCDGNGDGWLTVTANSWEYARFWQQLANAGLIEGQYDGVTSMPSTRIGTLPIWDTRANAGGAATTGQIYMFNGTGGGNSLYLRTPLFQPGVLKPEEAWNIDTKMDDGNAARGVLTLMVSTSLSVSNCTDAVSHTATTANWLVSSSYDGCGLVFNRQF